MKDATSALRAQCQQHRMILQGAGGVEGIHSTVHIPSEISADSCERKAFYRCYFLVGQFGVGLGGGRRKGGKGNSYN